MVWILHPWVSGEGLSYPTSPLFFAVELYLTAGLIGETVLRAVIQRAAFWSEVHYPFNAPTPRCTRGERTGCQGPWIFPAPVERCSEPFLSG